MSVTFCNFLITEIHVQRCHSGEMKFYFAGKRVKDRQGVLEGCAEFGTSI